LEKRVVIVDFNHLAHTYFFSQHRLSIRVEQNGESVSKDTTIQSGTIKNLYKWSGKGRNPMAICFDRPVPARKAFFQTCFSEMVIGTDKEYKGGREKMPEMMFEAISDVERVLRNAGVSCFAENNYESDDLILACIIRAKAKFPGMPIDVITNDADLLPLVDDTVSVFLRSKTATYAESTELEKAHYTQVTPRNYSKVVESLSYYRGFLIPYNTILLHKLLRGDVSDKFGRKDISRMFSAQKYNKLVEQMMADNINFEEIFRYGSPQYKILYRDSDVEFMGTVAEAMASTDKAKLYQKIGNSEQLNAIITLLRTYTELDEEQLSVLEKMYWGMNLNQVYPHTDKRLARREYVLNDKGHGDIDFFSEIELQKAVNPLQIRLIKA